ncbi:unnamed protein product [Mycena citricolor]|uniref:Cytochrome P450 n=1 Tax=Mycena citricolor TaxID=2018698 RepID=A0AAD2GR39_9AGAR|nr:unnamed protein product [Mycena citricolor]
MDYAARSILLTAAVLGAFQLVSRILRKSSLDRIPSVGVSSGPFGFYRGSWRYIKDARGITEEGCMRYPDKPFKVPFADRWLVLVSGPSFLEDIRKASDSELSQAEGANALLHLEHTLGHEQHQDPFQVPVVRSPLTRNIGVCFPDIHDEVVNAFTDLVPPSDEWISVPAMQTVLPIVSRISNRFFIGLQCRNPELISITTQFAQHVTTDAALLHITPGFLRNAVAHFFGHLESTTRKTMRLVGPLIQHRIDMDERYGSEWPAGDRPNDLISWLLDETRDQPRRRNVRTLTRTLLNVNFGAIHTTTQGFLHALYTIASHLEFVPPLREEIEAVVQAEGWTKAALAKMVKLDSFMKECARFTPGGVVALLRQTVKDFVFSDGTVVPSGTLIGVPVMQEHYKASNYTDGHIFDPFRFSRLRTEAGESVKHHMVTPRADFLTFGLGRHACPGRFFAVNEQKLLMAHMLVTYDVKLRDGKRPEDEWMFVAGAANSTAEVMFRKRQV